MMDRLQRWVFNGSYWPVLLESWLLAVAMLVLVLAVVAELPRSNIPTTFIFLSQVPVIWAALRGRPATTSLGWVTVWREIAFAAGLRGLIFVTSLGLVVAFLAQPYIQWGQTPFLLVLLAYTPSFLPFLMYRLFGAGLVAWYRLTRRRFLWMLVNSHLVTVFWVIVLVTFLLWFELEVGSLPARYPPGVLANVVLELVRTVIPWIGLGLVFFSLALALFFGSALLISYLAARRFERRIGELARAMKEVRQGDLTVRLTPTGRDEVAQLQADFNHMAARLQQERETVLHLLQNQRELSAVVSHELRTPISVMRAYLENDLLEPAGASPAAHRQTLETIHHETLKLQDLVEDLFTLSQLDQNRLRLECGPVDVARVVEQVVASLKKVAWETKRLDLCAQLSPALPLVWADDRRLEQVLSNLVQNSIRHTPPGNLCRKVGGSGGFDAAEYPGFCPG